MQAQKGDFLKIFIFLFAGQVLPITYLGVVRYKRLDLWTVTLKVVKHTYCPPNRLGTYHVHHYEQGNLL